MKRKILLYSLLALAAFFVVRAAYFMICNATYEPQHGDVIFHVSKSNQSTAIKLGTLSRYSHCGVLVIENGKPYVIEAWCREDTHEDMAPPRTDVPSLPHYASQATTRPHLPLQEFVGHTLRH